MEATIVGSPTILGVKVYYTLWVISFVLDYLTLYEVRS